MLHDCMLCAQDLNLYRPISNLSYVSKLLEQTTDFRFTEHVTSYNLFSTVQSAYRKCHSTETALVKIHNDLVTSVDQGHVGALALLDLSSAFDTVDHQLLLDILLHRFCISGPALAWFGSYLSGHAQVIRVNGQVSNVVNVHCGVPQGSVLGPKEFISYTWRHMDCVTFPLQTTHKHKLLSPPAQALTSVLCLQECIADISD